MRLYAKTLYVVTNWIECVIVFDVTLVINKKVFLIL
jgi:hypothetical protein